MITGIVATFVCSPSVIRAEHLMALRGKTLPLNDNYYGFVDRLWIRQRDLLGELRGEALARMIERGILRDTSPLQISKTS
jgi:hypothetical protein